MRQPTRILVIEDNAEVREEIADILTFEGFEVHQAANGRVGLDLIRQALPDLVLCDLMMPELDGYETLARVRSDAATAMVPFLCLTARAERRDLRRAMELGASDYITKPFTAQDLLGAIASVMEKRQCADQAFEAGARDFRQQLTMTLPHELRTPLHCILGFADLLTDPAYCADPAEVVEIAQNIHAAGRRLQRIAEHFVLYGRLSTGGPEALAADPQAAATALHTLVGEAASGLAAEHGRASDLRLDCRPVWARFGEEHLRTLVAELVDNAFKFSPPGSPVRVAVGPQSASALIRVEDYGRGMSADQIAAINGFTQFNRSVYEQQGLGMGLAIAQRIAALIAGGLDIESRPGHGTTITVTLPSAATAGGGDYEAPRRVGGA